MVNELIKNLKNMNDLSLKYFERMIPKFYKNVQILIFDSMLKMQKFIK